MDNLTWILLVIGFISAFLTVATYVPQVIKTCKSKDTSGISLLMYVILQFCSWLWVVYASLTLVKIGINFDGLTAGLPILLTNSILGFLGIFMLSIKIRNVKAAKKLNITEKEYVDKFLLKNKKNNKSENKE